MKGARIIISWERTNRYESYLSIKNTGDMEARNVQISAVGFVLFRPDCPIKHLQPGQCLNKPFLAPERNVINADGSFEAVVRYTDDIQSEEHEVYYTLLPKMKNFR